MTNLYKRIVFDRKLLRFVDDAFEEFIAITRFGKNFYKYDEDDMFYWEHRLSAWQSLVVQDSDYSRDMTMLFNNRKLQEVFLGVDVEYIIDDFIQGRLISSLWPETMALGVATNTGAHSLKARARQFAERLFFLLN